MIPGCFRCFSVLDAANISSAVHIPEWIPWLGGIFMTQAGCMSRAHTSDVLSNWKWCTQYWKKIRWLVIIWPCNIPIREVWPVLRPGQMSTVVQVVSCLPFGSLLDTVRGSLGWKSYQHWQDVQSGNGGPSLWSPRLVFTFSAFEIGFVEY